MARQCRGCSHKSEASISSEIFGLSALLLEDKVKNRWEAFRRFLAMEAELAQVPI